MHPRLADIAAIQFRQKSAFSLFKGEHDGLFPLSMSVGEHLKAVSLTNRSVPNLVQIRNRYRSLITSRKVILPADIVETSLPS